MVSTSTAEFIVGTGFAFNAIWIVFTFAILTLASLYFLPKK